MKTKNRGEREQRAEECRGGGRREEGSGGAEARGTLK
jgi:hypothetical protein